MGIVLQTKYELLCSYTIEINIRYLNLCVHKILREEIDLIQKLIRMIIRIFYQMGFEF